MNQILQHLGTGELAAHPVPCPRAERGKLLIESRTSLISAGTERMLLEFGRGSWIAKARQQPDRARQAVEKALADGIPAAVEAVRAKLDREIPLGYANAGRVVACGEGVTGFRPGDRVVSNGPHAEMVAVARNLCARIPDAVSDDEAPFAVLGAIALEGIRLLAPTIGERVVVSGLGLVGLLAAQLLRLNGCRVLGLDFDPARLELAGRWGVETLRLDGQDPEAAIERARGFSEGRGVDGVLIAAATDSTAPVRQAAAMCRQRGRVVLTGVAGLEFSRDLFYKKELSFQVSCSYGPGRYDDAYERQGQDYPFGHVRWTAQRNFEAALDLMADQRLQVRPLISHEFELEQAAEAYELLRPGQKALGILLRYPLAGPARAAKLETRIVMARYPGRGAERRQARPAANAAISAGLIGAGEFAGKVLLPEMRRAGVSIRTAVSASGLGAAWAARRFGIPAASTTEQAVLEDPAIDAVVIATRHDSHARLALAALESGKSVWVEKPLAMTEEEVDAIEEICARRPDACLMTGFNRRFSPWTIRLRQSMKPGRHDFRYTVNAGRLEAGHWTADGREGGGRILGEACHFLDLLRFLAGATVERLEARRNAAGAQLWLEFADGSTGTVDYLTEGSRRYPKEVLQVFGGGQVLVLDNFRRLHRYPSAKPEWLPGWHRQDKGHRAAMEAFFAAVRAAGPAPIPVAEQLEVSRLAIRAAEALRD
jgi:predicted dehydrogenase/threonine dehydrogenase-like Zn-dependent dehydrogenase